MQASDQPAAVSKKKPWAGIVVSALPALFLIEVSQRRVTKR